MQSVVLFLSVSIACCFFIYILLLINIILWIEIYRVIVLYCLKLYTLLYLYICVFLSTNIIDCILFLLSSKTIQSEQYLKFKQKENGQEKRAQEKTKSLNNKIIISISISYLWFVGFFPSFHIDGVFTHRCCMQYRCSNIGISPNHNSCWSNWTNAKNKKVQHLNFKSKWQS